MKEINLVAFDLDGTLVDSSLDIIAAVNYTRETLGLPLMEDKEIIGFVGDGSDKLVERFIGYELQHRREEAMAMFLAYYDEHLVDQAFLYPGVSEILDFFRWKPKVIITNKRYHFTRKITDAFNITGCFEEIIGMDSTPYRKPDARILAPLFTRFDVLPAHVLIVGDGKNDILLAENTGAVSCAMVNGFTPRETLLCLKPDFVCENMLELKGMFC